MLKPETIRHWIIYGLLNEPKLGENYIDWHTEDYGECGLTLIYPHDEFDIVIKRKCNESKI